jgi:HSP20 family molecular chaperone IbpA
MEIPVRMLKNTTILSQDDNSMVLQGERAIKPVLVSSYKNQPLIEESQINLFNKSNDWQTSSQLLNNNNGEQLKKQWFTTVQLDESFLKKCSKDNFSCIVSKVDPVLRVVVIKCKKQQMGTILATPIKRIISLPEHVDCRNVNVRICQQRKVIIVKAPLRYTPGQESEREFCNELEPTVYNVLEHLRSNCPRFMVPRYIRDVQTGQHKIYLDVHCSGFQPEEMKVTLKSFDRLLTLKGDRQMCHNKQPMWQYEMGFFPQTFRHEMNLPIWINMDKITWTSLNRDTLRVHLPITQMPNMEDINVWQKQGQF